MSVVNVTSFHIIQCMDSNSRCYQSSYVVTISRISSSNHVLNQIIEYTAISNIQKTADLVIFTEEILNGKLHFLCIVMTPYKNSLHQLNDSKYLITQQILRQNATEFTASCPGHLFTVLHWRRDCLQHFNCLR